MIASMASLNTTFGNELADNLREMFGNHVFVRLRRDGTEVEAHNQD